MYKGLNNIPQAVEYYKKAFALNSDSNVAYYIGVLYSEQENWRFAKINLSKSLNINPNNEQAKDLIASVTEQLNVQMLDEGIAFYDKGEYPKALAKLNSVIEN